MARRAVVHMVDDLDDTVIENGDGQTVSFGLDDTAYELDLTNEHADELRSTLARFVEVARKTGSDRSTRSRATSSRGPAKRDREQTQAIRDWAKQQGLQVSDRGRIARSIVDQYNAASR